MLGEFQNLYLISMLFYRNLFYTWRALNYFYIAPSSDYCTGVRHKFRITIHKLFVTLNSIKFYSKSHPVPGLKLSTRFD